MSEQLRRMENERKMKEYTHKGAKTRFLTKEFSPPVKAANAMIARRIEDMLSKDEKMYKVSQFKHDREFDYINELRKSLSIKLKNFDGDEFHRERVENRRTYTLRISRDDIIAMMMGVPQNSVLDFGPGNRPFYSLDPELRRLSSVRKSDKLLKRPKLALPTPSKPNWQRKNIKSKYSKYFRAQSARQPKTTSEHAKASGRVRPHTSMPRLTNAVKTDAVSPRLQSSKPKLQRQQVVKFNHYSDVQNEVASETGSNVTSSTSDFNRIKSFRTLRDMLTYKEEDETPLPDPKEELMKKCKNKESLCYREVEHKIKDFLKSIELDHQTCAH